MLSALIRTCQLHQWRQHMIRFITDLGRKAKVDLVKVRNGELVAKSILILL